MFIYHRHKNIERGDARYVFTFFPAGRKRALALYFIKRYVKRKFTVSTAKTKAENRRG